MIAYWFLFLCIAAGVLFHRESPDGDRPGVMFAAAIALITIMTGLRYEVGGDWQTYERLFHYTVLVGIERTIDTTDPGYQLVNWLVAQAGGTIVAVNLVCAIIFSWGLQRFARSQPRPWVSLLVAVPYLVVVVAMGYTRQATAIGILMAGLAALIGGAGIWRFTAYVAAAAMFHKTAVVMLPFAIFALQRNRIINLVVGVAASLLLYRYFLADALERFVENYLESEYTSQGAFIRLMMSFVPALLFFALGRRMDFDQRQYRLWWIFSATSVAMLALLYVLPSSTAVDRLALYLIPLQLVVVPRTIDLFKDQRIGRLLVLAYAAAVLFIWLNFATYSNAWIPYGFAPLG
ncbi:EpsG family protein [Sphingomonas jaspsi]|uniref:EpsG family protein n=1 Tax=Sphingomonas jaspsi TaxID=392409 RepID=UPI0004B0881A|nr:EpsG family protein [Sphingomonas jaspsi]